LRRHTDLTQLFRTIATQELAPRAARAEADEDFPRQTESVLMP
jgi:hypothetical protein